MEHYTNLTLPHDSNQETLFQGKVQILADEVLTIMKELHEEHRGLVNSKLIAQKMFSKESVKKLLYDFKQNDVDSDSSADKVKQSVDDVLNRFSESLPISMKEHLSTLKMKFAPSSSEDVLNNTDKIIKKLLETIASRVNELENILQKTTHFLFEMDNYLKKEVSLVDESYQESTAIKHSIFSDSRAIKESFDMSSDISTIKKAVFSRIANITKTIEEKREQDMFRLKETKKTLETMSNKMSDIVYEAEEIRKRSLETEIESLQDNLTKLYNRKAFDNKVEETLANLSRYNVSSSLIVCDLDNFKQINDTYGHRSGDLTLKKVAQIFKERLRKNDFIARYGGEEFIFILPHTSLKEAKEISEHIRSYIERTTFTYKNNDISLTISIGVSTFKEGDNASTVFERADAALYLAKKFGRNMVKTENDLESTEIKNQE
jgi:diguanylate cyclase (GGDEF)-like protein